MDRPVWQRWFVGFGYLSLLLGCSPIVGSPGGPCNLAGLCVQGSSCVSGTCESATNVSSPRADAGTAPADAGTTGPVDKGEYALISGGTFTMGSPTSELGRGNYEVEHQATISRSFYLKTTEVTQGEWRSLMGNDPSSFSSCGDACPVEQVSWWDGIAYMNALSAAEGLTSCYTASGCTGTPADGRYSCSTVTFAGLGCDGYRYPTESEWEYAARAGTTSAFYTGPISNATGSEPAMDRAGWYAANSGNTMHGVGQKEANAFGLYDMHGNLWEWVHDWYGDYSSSLGVDSVGPQSGTYRIIRGGSWNNNPLYCRSAQRLRYNPDYRYDNLGLRPSRSVP